jgi:SAM-dependent methyltransferase
LKINFACGKSVMDGYFNIDAVRAADAPRDPELLHALQFGADGEILTPIPLPDGCADLLLSVHFIEHVHRWETPHVIAEWARLLVPGGQLILEMPDIVKCARNIVKGVAGKHPEQLGMWGVYGDPREKNPYMVHRWGWTAATLTPLLHDNGFRDGVEKPTEFHGVGRHIRDFRLEATRA